MANPGKSFFLLAALLSSALFAELNIHIPKTSIEVHQSLSIKVSAQESLSSLELLTDAFTVRGQFPSSQISIVNGRVSKNFSLELVLSPKTAGKAQLSFRHKKEIYGPYTIDVRESSSGASTSGPGKKEGHSFFAEDILSKDSVYQFESFIFRNYLYAEHKLSEVDISRLNSLDGAVLKHGNASGQLEGQELRGDKRYRRYIIQESVLTPLFQTDLLIPGRYYQAYERQGWSTRKVDWRLAEKKVRIKALPEKGRPQDFKNAVGQFQLKHWINKNQAEKNEPLIYTIELSGYGDPEIIHLNEPAVASNDFSLRPLKSESEWEIKNERVYGKKTTQFYLFAQKSGGVKLPEYRFSFFDPIKERYQILTAESIDVQILANKSNPRSFLPSENDKSISENRALRALKENTYSKEKIDLKHLSLGLYSGLLFIAPLLAFFLTSRSQSSLRLRRKELEHLGHKSHSASITEIENFIKASFRDISGLTILGLADIKKIKKTSGSNEFIDECEAMLKELQKFQFQQKAQTTEIESLLQKLEPWFEKGLKYYEND